MIINKLDYFVNRTQVIILTPTREAAQTICKLVSSSPAASAITFHLSVNGTSIYEDMKLLEEQPHVIVGLIEPISDMLRSRAIDPKGIRFLCVDGVEHLLSVTYEKQFAEFCKRLHKNIELILLPTETHYYTPHDLSNLFSHEPLQFLVREDPAPGPGGILRDPDPLTMDPNQIGGMTRSADGYQDATSDTGASTTQKVSDWFCCLGQMGDLIFIW